MPATGKIVAAPEKALAMTGECTLQLAENNLPQRMELIFARAQEFSANRILANGFPIHTCGAHDGTSRRNINLGRKRASWPAVA
jgi:hypothetical protein